MMTAPTIATLRELAARFRDDERNLTLYFADLDTPPPPDSLNRVFGPPVGVTDEQWPTFPELAELLSQTGSLHHWDPRDARMEHVFTVDLRGVELLGVPPDAVAMMLFLSHAGFHRARHDGNSHTAVRFLRAHDLQRGVYQGSLPQRSLYRWSRRFSLVPIDVPGEVFDLPQLELPAGDALVELYEAIAEAPARLGGCPIGAPEADGWAESSPTLPWSETGSERAAERSSLTRPYVPSLALGSEPALESSLTIPYRPVEPALESSLTVPYRPVEGGPLQRWLESFGRRATGSRDEPEHEPVRSPSEQGSFLMQFQRRFADVHLGRRGVMYVSGRGAYAPTA